MNDGSRAVAGQANRYSNVVAVRVCCEIDFGTQ